MADRMDAAITMLEVERSTNSMIENHHHQDQELSKCGKNRILLRNNLRQNIERFMRLLLYHCFRENEKRAPSIVASYLASIYPEDDAYQLRVTESMIVEYYRYFESSNFDFDELHRKRFTLPNDDNHDHNREESEKSNDEVQLIEAKEEAEEGQDDHCENNNNNNNNNNNTNAKSEKIELNLEKDCGNTQSTNRNRKQKIATNSVKSTSSSSSITKGNSNNSKKKKKNIVLGKKSANSKAVKQRKKCSEGRETKRSKNTKAPKIEIETDESSSQSEEKMIVVSTDEQPQKQPICPALLSELVQIDMCHNNNRDDFVPTAKQKNLRRRQLFLHCYEAKYSATEATNYLNSIYGENFCTPKSVRGWYRRFEEKNFDLVDKTRSGRPAALCDDMIEQYMAANPSAVVPVISKHFGVHRQTMIRCLTRLGFRYVTDAWIRSPIDPAAIDDKQLCEFKIRHPQASVREIGEHFALNRAIVARKLRSFGFAIPKWPNLKKKAKTKTKFGSQRAGSTSKQVNLRVEDEDENEDEKETIRTKRERKSKSKSKSKSKQQEQYDQSIIESPFDPHCKLELNQTELIVSFDDTNQANNNNNNNNNNYQLNQPISPITFNRLSLIASSDSTNIISSSAATPSLPNLNDNIINDNNNINIIANQPVSTSPQYGVQSQQALLHQSNFSLSNEGGNASYSQPEQQQQQHFTETTLRQQHQQSFIAVPFGSNPSEVSLDTVNVQSILHPYYM